ncbi:helix-turn-helix domain-containing protein [Singulisphaera sp. PoT]|uniref:AraC family transcriptional regulator n=1 Tax=Singulisphaera sp. PoT TaxID=3411797 RepID=UPI003BF50C0C
MRDPRRFQERFFAKLEGSLALAPLFEYLPEVYLYVKDRRSRFVKVNEALWKLRGRESEAEMIGLCDRDIHPQHLADQYIAEDQRVMRSGKPLPNQIWLVPGQGEELKWFISSKIPLFDAEGRVIGIAGVMRDLEKAESLIRPYREMDEVITHVLRHYADPIEVTTLAALVHISVSQLDRRFKRLYQMTPMQYVLRVRINAACQALSTTDRSIAEIAQACGFYDQSYFTKQFRKHLLQTPTDYRARYRGQEPPDTASQRPDS